MFSQAAAPKKIGRVGEAQERWIFRIGKGDEICACVFVYLLHGVGGGWGVAFRMGIKADR